MGRRPRPGGVDAVRRRAELLGEPGQRRLPPPSRMFAVVVTRDRDDRRPVHLVRIKELGAVVLALAVQIHEIAEVVEEADGSSPSSSVAIAAATARCGIGL